MSSQADENEKKEYRRFLYLFVFGFLGIALGNYSAMSYQHKADILSQPLLYMILAFLGCLVFPGFLILAGAVFLIYKVAILKRYDNPLLGCALVFLLTLLGSFLLGKVFTPTS